MPLNAFIKFEPTDDGKALIKANRFTGGIGEITVNHSYDKCQQALFTYNQGAKIQRAFPFLTLDEREFMMTGMGGPEFDELCAEIEE